jgi:hypothetical protein
MRTLALIFLMTAACPGSLHAQDAERIFSQSVTAAGEKSWSVQVWQHPADTELRIQESGPGAAAKAYQILFPHQITRIRQAERLDAAGYPDPLLVTVWLEGARREVIRVFDPRLPGSAGLLFELGSASTLSWQRTPQGKLQIDYFEPSEDGAGLNKVRKLWIPINRPARR